MRKIVVCLLITFFALKGVAQELSYYLPDSVSYNPAIPTPEKVIGHHVGEWHVTHDRLVTYMRAVAAAAPDRIQLEVTGYTYEARPQLLLTITAKNNLQNIENIRQQHVQLTDAARSASLNTASMPAVVWMGYSIHGNESSGSNAALLAVYYLAAAQGPQIEALLQNTVILVDPSFNPDGLNRFATWANMHKSKNLVTDPASREFNEVWPGGRFNHYWFDLNRDWLPAVHVESQNRLRQFYAWRPNILTDHHEMGSNSSFFFQPGVPSRVNPLTPEQNQQLTAEIGKFHAAFLNRIGSLYFTKEGYDDFYYGKGSTFPDVNGGIGILFEQASSRGHAQQTVNGLLSFPFTIRNQFVTTLSTLEAAKNMRQSLLNYQRDFYKNAATEAAADAVKAYVFGDANDPVKTMHFIELLQRQQIEIYPLTKTVTAGGSSFEPATSYIVPVNQQQYKLVKTLFEKQLQFKDSIFYDVSAWTMPLAFDIPAAAIAAPVYTEALAGKKLTAVPWPAGSVAGGTAGYAYLFEWNSWNAPKALYRLMEEGVTVKAVTNPLQLPTAAGSRWFGYGSIIIPVAQQKQSPAELYKLVAKVAEANRITIYATGTGNATEGSDLGSTKMAALTKPQVAMLVGGGVSATDAGEIWHLMDQRLDIPATHLEKDQFNNANLSKYNTLVLVSGNYDNLDKEKLKTWVQNGGVLIAFEEALTYVNQAGIMKIEFKKPAAFTDSGALLPYAQREQTEGAQQMPGAILKARIDLTHPLNYGYSRAYTYLFKSNKIFPLKSKNPYSTPGIYEGDAVQSGYLSKANNDNVKNTAAVLVQTVGSGRVIAITDNPAFRAFWLGGAKLFVNALFYGRIIEAASARAED
jgi:hypothetical protein